MNTKRLITICFIASLGFTACQKSALEENLFDAADQAALKAADDEASNDVNTLPPSDPHDPIYVLPGDIDPHTPGAVKEVSDGDDESDDDETKKGS